MQISPEFIKLYNLNPEWEWYDNSTLSIIDQCIRKAYWKLLFPLPNSPHPGIQDKVGVAAHYGTCIHAAMDKMYSPIYSNLTYHKRKILAFKAYSQKYQQIVKDPDLVEDKYSHSSGVCLLDDYFAHYENEDSFYRPIETELCLVVPITDLDPPFYYIFRIDGVVERIAMGDLLVREFKTTSSSLQNKLNELRISRQCEGYVWGCRQFKTFRDLKISGVMADVLAVRVKERDPEKLFARDIFHINELQAEMWRKETVNKVRRWRAVKNYSSLLNNEPLIQHHYFDRNTNECTRYGLCSYYQLCVNGINSVDLNLLVPNDWNPLNAEKLEAL